MEAIWKCSDMTELWLFGVFHVHTTKKNNFLFQSARGGASQFDSESNRPLITVRRGDLTTFWSDVVHVWKRGFRRKLMTSFRVWVESRDRACCCQLWTISYFAKQSWTFALSFCCAAGDKHTLFPFLLSWMSVRFGSWGCSGPTDVSVYIL